jgi:hypothetical protein
MRFKIVSVGWQCADWLEQTLASVEAQSVDNWDIWITYDPSDDDGAELIEAWCSAHDDPRWNFQLNTERRYAVRNQYDAIVALGPEDDDVVIFLDLDGDMLAHSDVLAHVAREYDDDTLVTYGSYVPVPDMGTSPIAEPFPADVVAKRAYRRQMLTGVCCFNHLRTMKGRVFNAIPSDQFQHSNGKGWYTIGTDYIFMTPALELADGRYKCLSEVLVKYNHDNPHADFRENSVDSFDCVQDCLHRPALPRLVVEPNERFLSLEPELRREALRSFGENHGLNILVETGTNQGLTPLHLARWFREIYTIELDDHLHATAKRRLASLPNITCLHGDSTDMLPEVLRTITEPALFWLDGHYSGPGTGHGVVSTPIRDELRLLFEDGRPHVILVDDARIFGGGPEHTLYDHYEQYPTLEWVEEFAAAYGYGYELRYDIIRLLPNALG